MAKWMGVLLFGAISQVWVAHEAWNCLAGCGGYFTAFVGLNLFQSAFTDWCPMTTFLRKLEVK